MLTDEELCHQISEAGTGLVGGDLLHLLGPGAVGSLFFQSMQALQAVGNDLRFFRITFFCPVESTVQNAGHGKPPDLLFVLPIVAHGIPGEENRDVRGIPCIFVSALGPFAEGMYNAGRLDKGLIFGLVKTGQQQPQKSGVIIERELTEPSVVFPQILT